MSSRSPNGASDAPIVRASLADLSYVVQMQKTHGHAIGFIPRMALQEKIELERIWLATENDEPAGYLHHGSLNVPEVRIFQAAIQYDARRRHLGRALVDDLVERSTRAGAQAISLRCLSFLEANEFWKAAGFRLIDQEPGAKGKLNVWGRRLGKRTDSAFAFHSRAHACPNCGASTMDTWQPGARRFNRCRACLSAGHPSKPI